MSIEHEQQAVDRERQLLAPAASRFGLGDPRGGPMSENVIRYYWRGHGRLWKVYWLYGVLGSNVLAGILLLLVQRGAFETAWFEIVLLLLAAYTVWIVVAVWRCAFNVEDPRYGHMARALTVAWAINAFFVLGFLQLEFLRAVT